MNLSEFQPSGRPFVKSGVILNGVTDHVEFPFVTQSVMIHNRSSGDLKLYFADPATTDAASEGNEFVLMENRDTVSFHVAVKELWIVCSDPLLDGAYSLAAELSEQASSKFTQPSGEGIGTEV